MIDLLALTQSLEAARNYTLGVLADIEPEQWFWQPSEGVTCVAWQVGHLAIAEYGLCLSRVRGRRAEDAALLPAEFSQRYGRGSEPSSDPAENASVESLRTTLEAVHRQALDEIPTYTQELLNEPLDEPHPIFKKRGDGLAFCPSHELVHAGQLALLRRLMGKPPLR